MIERLTIIAALFALTACSDPDGARRAAENLGLTDVKSDGWRWLGCGEGDVYHTGFTARNPKGEPVSGVVCSGWFKGSTVRFD